MDAPGSLCGAGHCGWARGQACSPRCRQAHQTNQSADVRQSQGFKASCQATTGTTVEMDIKAVGSKERNQQNFFSYQYCVRTDMRIPFPINLKLHPYQTELDNWSQN